MSRWLRSAGYAVFFLAAIFGVISLTQGEHGEVWNSAMLVALTTGLALQLPTWLLGTLKPLFTGTRIPTRPRQSSQVLLRVPTAWQQFYRGFGLWGVFCLVVSLLSSDLALMLLLLGIPALLFLLLWHLIHPGPSRERRMLAGQLAAGLEAGIPLIELLEQLKCDALSTNASRLGGLPTVLDWIAFDMRCGSQFSMAVSNHRYFPIAWGPILTAGERAERLPEALRMLARLEEHQPLRAYLLRPLLSLPVVLMLAFLTSQVALKPEALELPPLPSTTPLSLALGLAILLAIFSLGAPWLKGRGRLSKVRDRLQRLPWIWPLAHQEEQLMAVTAILAGIGANCDATELVELGRTACTHGHFTDSLNPERAAAGDSLSQILRPAFSSEVVALVAYGEAHNQLLPSLEAAQDYLEGRLAEERLRLERRYLLVFQILTGLLVLLCAYSYYVPLETFYLGLIQEQGL